LRASRLTGTSLFSFITGILLLALFCSLATTSPVNLLTTFLVFLGAGLVALNIIKNWHHVIMILILIEILILQGFFFFALLVTFLLSLNFLFLFSTLMVIEASLGISLLACVSRSHGDDYILIF